jgi:hypothetical protein
MFSSAANPASTLTLRSWSTTAALTLQVCVRTLLRHS